MAVYSRYRRGGLPERPMGADCKSVGFAFEGSNPSPATQATTPWSAPVTVLTRAFRFGGAFEPEAQRIDHSQIGLLGIVHE